MTSAYPTLLAVLAADLRAFAPAHATPFAVHVGRATGEAPYAVLAPGDVESESTFAPDKSGDGGPVDTLMTVNVHGALEDVPGIAAAIQNRWMGPALNAPLASAGRRVIRQRLAQSLPLPPGDASSPLVGRRVGVRFTTQPTA